MSIKLVFLGTGSGKPLPSRGASSVGLFRHGELFLFDCGEGTQVQLAKSSLRSGSLGAVLLSHFHGDHVNGVPGLLGTMGLDERAEALPLYGPKGLKKWLAALRAVGIFHPGFPLKLHEIDAPGVLLQGQGWHIETLPLAHRVPCWGFAFVEAPRPGRFDLEAARALGVPAGPMFGRLQRGEAVELEGGRLVRPEQVLGLARPGLKVAYCCDTMPCEDAVVLARGADVLIHEATYPAGHEKLARSRGHSTSADAARCAKEAGVKRLILTHFSQKYPDLGVFLDTARDIFPHITLAHDLMEYEVTYRES